MKNSLPVMLLKGLVLLPNQEVKLDINNKISKKIIMMSAKNYKNEIMIVCPKDQKEEDPEVTDLPFIGVACKITSKIELSNGHLKVTIKGVKRVAIEEYSNNIDDMDILECSYKEIILPKFKDAEVIATKRKLIDTLKKYIDLNPQISNSIINIVKNETDLYKITDQITLFIPLSIEKKLEYMEEINSIKRAKNLIKDLNIEIEICLLDAKIENDLAVELEETQKEFILKEKIKQIKKELKEEDSKDLEVERYLENLNKLSINNKIRNRILREIKKFELTNDMSPESSIIRNYLDCILELPWNTETIDEQNIETIKKHLDKSHYGLEEIKERILEYVVAKKRNEKLNSPIICLVGPPGVGKTTIASSIANALNKKFAKISVGGLNDSSELNGHRRTYIGAEPGKIINSIKKCGSKNPVILIDEVDKMVKDYKGDPASVLLEILDFEQNKTFTDHYIDEEFDLSKSMFILTANNKDNIPAELFDRLEIIELSSYTVFEKIDIAKKYLLPRIFENYGIKSKEIRINSEVLKIIIEEYTKEAGVRELSRLLDKLIRKVIMTDHTDEIKILPENLKEYLKKPKYENELVRKKSKIGYVNALAYTPYGGIITPIETTMYDGTGKLKLTGELGEVLKESAEVALSYIKSNNNEFKINENHFKNKDIHLHMLDGATKKDGPSAGVSITTALISLLMNKPVISNIAMTGEISLKGDILKIGGIKEKIIGAYNNGIKVIFIPKLNHNDLDEIPIEILKNITIIEVTNYIEVYNNIFG